MQCFCLIKSVADADHDALECVQFDNDGCSRCRQFDTAQVVLVSWYVFVCSSDQTAAAENNFYF